MFSGKLRQAWVRITGRVACIRSRYLLSTNLERYRYTYMLVSSFIFPAVGTHARLITAVLNRVTISNESCNVHFSFRVVQNTIRTFHIILLLADRSRKSMLELYVYMLKCRRYGSHAWTPSHGGLQGRGGEVPIIPDFVTRLKWPASYTGRFSLELRTSNPGTN
jgi:hypothetical protein